MRLESGTWVGWTHCDGAVQDAHPAYLSTANLRGTTHCGNRAVGGDDATIPYATRGEVGSEPWRNVAPRRKPADRTRGVFQVDWPLFGELSRALALKVAREYDPEIVVGIATAGVIPGAVVAAILGREFHSIVVSRRFHAESPRETPAILGAAPTEVRNRRVLVVDETCDSGETLRMAVAAIVNAGATDVRTAVGFRTGTYEPDFSALETESTIVLPWDEDLLASDA